MMRYGTIITAIIVMKTNYNSKTKIKMVMTAIKSIIIITITILTKSTTTDKNF